MFTILNDATYSSVCINCLEEEDLDICYSETAVGRCDECLTAGRNRTLKPIVIAATVHQADIWARHRDINPNWAILIGTDSYDPMQLEGKVATAGQIVLLPIAEEGRDWVRMEDILKHYATHWPTPPSGLAGTISAGSLPAGTVSNFQLNITNNVNLTQYSRMLYGLDLGVRNSVRAAVTGVT